MGTFDGIIDTVSAVHAISPLIDLLKSHGKLIMVGAPDKPLKLPVYPLLMGTFAILCIVFHGQVYNNLIKFCLEPNVFKYVNM